MMHSYLIKIKNPCLLLITSAMIYLLHLIFINGMGVVDLLFNAVSALFSADLKRAAKLLFIPLRLI